MRRCANRRLARCPSGTSPTSTPASTIRRSGADLDRADAESVAFEEAYKGKLDELARGPDAGAALGEAVRLYEALDDLMGGSVPMRGSSMRATPSIRRAPNFTATCRNG